MACNDPNCPETQRWPKPDLRCICNKPLWISVPAGQHIHMTCPVHGDFVIRGSDMTCKVSP